MGTRVGLINREEWERGNNFLFDGTGQKGRAQG